MNGLLIFPHLHPTYQTIPAPLSMVCLFYGVAVLISDFNAAHAAVQKLLSLASCSPSACQAFCST